MQRYQPDISEITYRTASLHLQLRRRQHILPGPHVIEQSKLHHVAMSMCVQHKQPQLACVGSPALRV